MGKKLSTAAALIIGMFLTTASEALMDPSGEHARAMSDEGVIEVVSKYESEVPGYFHQKYIYWHESCPGGKPVDYYGPAIDPNDANLLKEELRLCKEIPDGGADSGD